MLKKRNQEKVKALEKNAKKITSADIKKRQGDAWLTEKHDRIECFSSKEHQENVSFDQDNQKRDLELTKRFRSTNCQKQLKK